MVLSRFARVRCAIEVVGPLLEDDAVAPKLKHIQEGDQK